MGVVEWLKSFNPSWWIAALGWVANVLICGILLSVDTSQLTAEMKLFLLFFAYVAANVSVAWAYLMDK